MGDTGMLLCCGCCFIFPTFALQAIGFFSAAWVSNESCDSLGLFYHCCGGSDKTSCNTYGDDEELDDRVLALQATSFTVMILTIIGLCCSGEDGDGCCGLLGGCCFVCYPVAGLLSVVGCIVLATKHSTSELGYSFYLCVASGSFVLLLTICGIMCYTLKDDDDTVSTRGRQNSHLRQNCHLSTISDPRGGNLYYGQSYGGSYGGSEIESYQPSRGQIAPYGGDQSFKVHAPQATVHHVAIVHDEELGGFLMSARRFQITGLVTSFHHSNYNMKKAICKT